MGVADALTSPAGVPHGGIVTFKDGSTVIGTTSVDLRGRATLVISTLQASGNPHTITAVYGGNGNFSPSTSNSLVYTITQGANAGARAVPTSSSPLTKTMATSFAAAAPEWRVSSPVPALWPSRCKRARRPSSSSPRWRQRAWMGSSSPCPGTTGADGWQERY